MTLPDDSQRLSMYGKTGEGKTVAGLWHLSQRSITERPWVVFDFKGDEHIAALPYAHETDLREIPKEPGLHVVRPVPEADDDAVEAAMWSIWERGNTGVFIDEGYMVGQRNKAFKALLTQGRSKSIPMITLSQRPVWLSRFAISEADYHQVFFLSDESDRETVQRFIPHDFPAKRLPRFHSYYYDVANDEFLGLKPVPPIEAIMATFQARLQKPKQPMRLI